MTRLAVEPIDRSAASCTHAGE